MQEEDPEDIIITRDTDPSKYSELEQAIMRSIGKIPIPSTQSRSILDFAALGSYQKDNYLETLESIRKWRGERYSNGKWVPLPEGKYWDYLEETYKDGAPPLSFYDWYCEFVSHKGNFANPTKMGKCHKEWGSLYENTDGHLILLCPRDHFKSTYIVIGGALHTICEHPEIAKEGLMFISFSDDLAKENLESVRNNLMYNERITSFYGELIDTKRPCNADMFYLKYQSMSSRLGFCCTSLQSGNITGRHPARVWCDDIQDEEFSSSNMKKAINIFTKKLFPAIGTKGKIILTGTIKGRSENSDIYLWLSKRYGFHTYRFQAVNMMPPMSDVEFSSEEVSDQSDSGISRKIYHVKVLNREQYIMLYPERYTIEDLVIKRLQMKDKGMGDDIFWSEFMLTVFDPKSVYFKMERLGYLNELGYQTVETFLKLESEKIKGPVLWIDPGGRGNVSHGNTVVIMAQKDDLYILLYFTRIRKGLKDVANIIYELYERFHCKAWGVEGNFNQAETHGATLYNYIIQNGNEIPKPVIESNRLEKYIRIRDIFSVMLGIEGTPKTFFVYKNIQEFDDFYQEFNSFPNRVDRRGEFDILDACCSLKIFLLDRLRSGILMSRGGQRWR